MTAICCAILWRTVFPYWGLIPPKHQRKPRKVLDVSVLHALGWRHRTPLDEGIRLAYEDFLANRVGG